MTDAFEVGDAVEYEDAKNESTPMGFHSAGQSLALTLNGSSVMHIEQRRHCRRKHVGMC
jgi:hypothetical protein